MKLIFFTVCGILLLLGCGSDETPEPMEVMPNYFPDTSGVNGSIYTLTAPKGQLKLTTR